MEPQISGLTLSVIAMGIVFIVLYALALLINLLRILVGPKEDRKTGQAPAIAAEPEADFDSLTEIKGFSPQVVAAITGAVAAYMGQGTTGLRISALRRVESQGTWANAGRVENTSKLRSLQTRR
ncbi:MAG: OadG family protein [bacterium]